ncbi:MAG: aldo/keto reductase, partial [Brooklawnia sp.]
METRRLGDSDLMVSVVGMGGNNFSRPKTASETQEGSVAVIQAAIDAGITFIDGADIYGTPPGTSEEFIAEAIKGRRDQVVLSTKFGFQGVDMYPDQDLGPKGGERYIRYAVEQSLRRLQTDRIDLLQMHSPDPDTPIAETLRVLTDLVAEGKVRHVGNSNFTAEQLVAADEAARANGFVRFVSAQNGYSLIEREAETELLPTAERLGLGFFPYYPLFNGLLTGKYTQGIGEGRLSKIKPQLLETTDWDRLKAYQQLCDEAGFTMLQATFSWMAAQAPIA